MNDWDSWYLGKGRAPIEPQIEPTLWEKCRFYVIAVLIASLLALGFALIAWAEPVALKASWYSRSSLIKEGTWKHGEQKMANGKRFDENALTCAARLWPLGTVLRVVNENNHRAVRVVVTDRIGKRFGSTRIDLAKAAFARIADLKAGVVPVTVEVL